jgi:hypothetical protein
MYNRKLDIKRDFSKLNELENKILPIIRNIKNLEDQMCLESYVRNIFSNQFKK